MKTGSGYEKQDPEKDQATKTSVAQAKAAFMRGEKSVENLQRIGDIRSYSVALKYVDQWSEELNNAIIEHNSEMPDIVIPESERTLHTSACEAMSQNLQSMMDDLEAIESQEQSLATILERLSTHPEFEEVDFAAACRAVNLAGNMVDRRSKLLKDFNALFKLWKAETALDMDAEATRRAWSVYRQTQARVIAEGRALQKDKPKQAKKGLDL